MCARASGLLRSRHLYRSLPFGPLRGARSQRVAGDAASGSLGLEAGRGFWVVSPCWKGPRGKEPSGTRHRSDSVWAPRCRSPLQPRSPAGTRKPHLQRVPAPSTVPPALIPSRLCAKGPEPRAPAGAGRAGSRGRAGQGLGHLLAVPRAVPPARPRCRHLPWHECECRCLVFSFLELRCPCGGLSGRPWGSTSPPGAANRGGERSASVGPPRTFRGGWDRPLPLQTYDRCAQLFLNVNSCTDVQIQCSCYRMNKVLF